MSRRGWFGGKGSAVIPFQDQTLWMGDQASESAEARVDCAMARTARAVPVQSGWGGADPVYGYRRRSLPDGLYRCMNERCRAVWYVPGEESPTSCLCPNCNKGQRHERRYGPWPLAWRDSALRPWSVPPAEPGAYCPRPRAPISEPFASGA